MRQVRMESAGGQDIKSLRSSVLGYQSQSLQNRANRKYTLIMDRPQTVDEYW